MGQTAIISPQIVDSTSIGRDLITAADQASAQAIIGVAGVDVTADYNWTGNHDFSGTFDADAATFSGTVNTDEVNSDTLLKVGGSVGVAYRGLELDTTNGTLKWKYNNIAKFSVDTNTCTIATTTLIANNVRTDNIRPIADDTYALGESGFRWSDIYAKDGSFSGNLTSEVGGSYKLYNLGTEGDADTEYLEVDAGTNTYSIYAKATGTGVERELTVGNVNNRFRFTSSGALCAINSVTKLNITSNFMYFHCPFVLPNADNTVTLGRDTQRWKSVGAVNGDFSGTITNTATTGWAATFDRGVRVGADSGVSWFFGNGNATKFGGSVIFESSFQFARPADGINSRLYRFKKDASAFTFRGVDAGVSGATIFQVEDATSTFQPLRTGGIVNHYPDNSGAQAYRLYNLGEFGDTDTEYLEKSWDANAAIIETKATGSGAARELRLVNGTTSLKLESTLATLIANNNNVIRGSGTSATYLYSHSSNTILEVGNGEFKPFSGTVALGSTANRWSTVYGVDGDFSGTVQSEYVTGVNGTATDANLWFRPDFGHLFIKSGASNVARFAATGVLFYANCSPQTSDLYDMGTSVQRWRSVGSVDGTFSGNLNTEVSGTQRVYGLGTDGDTDTEYIESSWDGTTAKIQTKETGSGVLRAINVLAGSTGMKAYANSTLLLSSAWSSVTMNNVSVSLAAPSAGYVAIRNGDLRPYDAVTPINCGQPAVPWAGVYSVDGDFSGDVVMAANVDFTGLPTSDPSVAGRLWNNNGTLKISAGGGGSPPP